jgi:hypothetical protein
LLQLLARCSQLPHELSLREQRGLLVERGVIFDALRAGPEAQRRQRLERVLSGRADAHDESGASVAAKAALQQARQLGVTVGDVSGRSSRQRKPGVEARWRRGSTAEG